MLPIAGVYRHLLMNFMGRELMNKKGIVIVIGMVLICCLASAALAGPAMDRILKKGTLVVGITGAQPPLNATAKDMKIIGLDADMARLISDNLGVKLEFAKFPFAELLPALEKGKIDMIISGMTMTLERNRTVAFVGPYYISGKGILTTTGKISTLQDPQGLNKPEYKVAALTDSTSQALVKAALPKAELVTVQNYDAAIAMLHEGKIDALVADYPFCAYTAFRNQDKGLLAAESKLNNEPLGIAVPEDALLINWLQNFLLVLNGSGTLQLMNKRWFGDKAWIELLP
jgi:polar amino acid transport system substrate-binding protein